MRQKPFDLWIAILLAVVCVAACALFTFLPDRVLDTNLVYQGF